MALSALALVASSPAQAALRAPAPQAPAVSASVEALPTFTWRPVKGAAKYEFQLSDDSRFRSIVLGRGKGKGAQETKNTAATLDKSVPDGNYFWRVRAIDRKDRVGRWSRARSLTKAWKSAPALESADDLAVSWPSTPLLLRWSPAKYATRYLVTIATDPSLAQVVTGKPVEVPGNAFALQGTLPVGRYYWAVTPVDAGDLRGTRSRVGAFTWSWPTSTPATVADLNASDRVFDPLFSWNLVPGAARYEVEINPDDDFAAGSRVCCKDPIIGTSLSPVRILPNNNDVGGASGYYWRVRAFDVDGNPGQWNRGPTFEKAYDDVTPTVPNVQLRDYTGQLSSGASTVTNGPIIAWDPVPGAVQYQVQWTVHDGFNCNWTAAGGAIKTSSLYWTPLSATHESGIPGGIGITSGLGPNGTGARSGQPFTPEGTSPTAKAFADNVTYCVRVRALSDDSFNESDSANAPVISLWTQLGGGQDTPAFTYDAPPSGPNPSPPIPQLPAPTYLEPLGTTYTRTPLFRWNPVPGALRYFVLIARDSNFTNVVDVAFTGQTSYAPNWVFEDEATSYFWAVVPSATTTGSGISGGPKQYNPQTFNKLSIPPGPIEPVGGVDVAAQPTFRWSPAEGAQKYRIQVSADPNFGDLLDNVVTASTAYTSSTPYPIDTALYWRVRAEQLLITSSRLELRWSPTQSFRRRLPAPVLSGDIPLTGQLPPALTWSAVPGAISYDVRVEEADGDSNDFNVKSVAGTFTKFVGLGTFNFRVRANYATRSGAVASAYSAPRQFTRVLSAPTGRRVNRSAGRLYFNWNPAAAASSYQVEVSTTQSFSRRVESVKTNNTSWAPELTNRAYAGSGPLYWRVATVDGGGNVGAFESGPVRVGKPLTVRLRGTLRRNRTARVIVSVRGSGRALRSASVRASGAGVRTATRRTNRRGSATFRLRPRSRGTVTFTVTRSGYAPKTVRLRVR